MQRTEEEVLTRISAGYSGTLEIVIVRLSGPERQRSRLIKRMKDAVFFLNIVLMLDWTESLLQKPAHIWLNTNGSVVGYCYNAA